jgi:hypothetical protein
MGGLHVLLGATTHVLRPHRVPRQTPHTLGRALGLLASAFALVNERNEEAGVLVGGLSGASPIPTPARDARGGGCGPGSARRVMKWAMSEAGDRPACGTWPDQGELAATGDRLLDGSCVLR